MAHIDVDGVVSYVHLIVIVVDTVHVVVAVVVLHDIIIIFYHNMTIFT